MSVSTDHPDLRHSDQHSGPDAPDQAPTDRRAMLAGLGGLAAGAILAGARSAHAGPLNPPPGPITPTGVTLDEIAARTARPNGIAEPRRPLVGNLITQPGSYYLTADRIDESILISATDVTLDLSGYRIKGDGLAAIELIDQADRVVIRNGRVDARAVSFGILSQINASVTIEDIHIFGSSPPTSGAGVSIQAGSAVCRRVTVDTFRNGIVIASGVIDDCHTINCPSGLISFGQAVVRRSTARGAGLGPAIEVGPGSAIIDCHVSSVGPSPAIRVGAGSLVDQCVVAGGRPGIITLDNAAVLRCVVRSAQGIGIFASNFCRIADCTVTGSTAVAGGEPGLGVRAGQRLRLERSNIASNASRGVRCTAADATITDCSITDNGAVGIDLIGPALIDRCHLHNNQGGMFFDALVRVNACHLDFNGPFGIWANSTTVGGTFITDCDIIRHVNGIDIRTASGSGVFRSRFAGNTTNIIAAAGNYAQIVFGPAAASTATNPNINIAL